MSLDFNEASLIGRLTKDPETTTLQSGKQVTKFTLAVGEGKDRTSFIECEAWGPTSELLQKHVIKGEAIAVHGALNQQTWEDKSTGAKRSKLIVRVDRVRFLPTNKPHEKQQWDSTDQSGDIPF